MSREDPLLVEYKVLRAITGGKLPVHVNFRLTKEVDRVTNERIESMTDPTVGISYHSIKVRLDRLESEGAIVGWSPVLSEKGHARLKALETLFGDVTAASEESP